MTDSASIHGYLGEPIPPGFDRAAWHIFEREIRQLIDMDAITGVGLTELRRRLRSREWDGAPEDVQARRRLLLADVATALGAKTDATDYYRAVGDMPAAPDDLAGLDTPGA